MGFWDDVRRSIWDNTVGFTQRNMGKNSQQRKSSSNRRGPGSPIIERNRRANADRLRRDFSPKGTRKYTGGDFTNMPRNLMKPGVAGRNADAARYTKQAAARGLRPGSISTYSRGGGTNLLSDVGGGGGGSFEDILNEVTGGASYTPPTYEVPQIDVMKTLAGIFDPQFAAISRAEKTAKGNASKSDRAIAAAYQALTDTIKGDAKNIDKSYNEATSKNTADAKAVSKTLSDTASKQSREEMELAAALGIGSAVDSNSGGKGELNKAIADVASSTKDSNARLAEFKTIDKQLNTDSATVTALSGKSRQSDIQKQLNSILADLGTRRVDTTVNKANKKAELEAQNQAAINEANSLKAQDYQNFQKTQADVTKEALGIQMDRAKMQQELDLANQNNSTRRYVADSRVDSTAINAASKKSSGGSGNETAKQALINSKAEGLGADSITGIIDNLTGFYNGDWDDALKKYSNRYKKSNRSKRVAAEYVRRIKRG